jgi:thymidine kinase
MDIRFGASNIKCRAGLEKEADILISSSTNLLELPAEIRDTSCLLVDECQFLEPRHIEELREITKAWSVPVICYGLRTDFRTNLFPASKRLLELADNIEEVKTTCFNCNKKAVLNLKHVDGVANVDGPVVQLGAEEAYYPACYTCYRDSLALAGQPLPFV